MTDTIEVYVDCDGAVRRVGRFRCASSSRRRSSIFEYADEWLEHGDAFAIDPGKIPLEQIRIYKRSEMSVLPGALLDIAPDRWGRLLIRRAFRKTGEQRPPQRSTICWRYGSDAHRGAQLEVRGRGDLRS